MDDFSVGRAHHMYHPSGTKERHIWLLHRGLGHPSFGYMQHLLPYFFHIYQLLTLSVILESLLKVIELLIH